jgi:transposase
MPKLVKVTRPVDEKEMLKLQKTHADPRVRSRCLMLLKVFKGQSCLQVSKELLVSKNTVVKWVTRYNDFGIKGLTDENRSGRPPIIDYDELQKALTSSPREYGYDYEAWIPRLVYLYLYEHQKLTEMEPLYVYEVIKRCGYKLIVPKGKHYKSNPAEVEAFKKKWQHILILKA